LNDDSDPKPCPKHASSETTSAPDFVTVAASQLTPSPARELNRRPLLSSRGWFSGISRLLNGLKPTFQAFASRKTGNSRPETVPKPCLSDGRFSPLHTNLTRRNFTPETTAELVRTAREESGQAMRAFQFRRQY
jgi:hypothetical protein